MAGLQPQYFPPVLLNMNSVIGRAIRKSPQLYECRLTWARRTALLSRKMAGLAALCIGGLVVAVATFLRASPGPVMQALKWADDHSVVCALVAACVAYVLVSRRHCQYRIRAQHSWTAALPVEPSGELLQAVVIGLWPVAISFAVMIFVLAGLHILVLGLAEVSATRLVACLAVGTVIGCALGYLGPETKMADRYEDSRYVLRFTGNTDRLPKVAFSALAYLPLRKTLANARPRNAARVFVLFLLLVPMNTAASQALLLLAFFSVVCLMLMLTASTISEYSKMWRWLRPLPVKPRQLAQAVMSPVLATMLCGALIASTLLSVLSMPFAPSIAAGLSLFFACAATATFASFVATGKGTT